MNYSTTPIQPDGLTSPELRGIAGEAIERIIDTFEINNTTGQVIGEALMYQTFPNVPVSTLVIAPGGAYIWEHTIDGRVPTDDDYDDTIREWMKDTEIGFPDDM